MRNSNLFSKIRYYIEIGRKLQDHLTKLPNEWMKFQKDFNVTVDRVYEDITLFESENAEKDDARVERLKKIFAYRYRRYFLHGDFIKWSFERPFGYSGDFKMIDDIYLNNPVTVGFDRLWDNYFHQLEAVKAIRERKEDFKAFICRFIKERPGGELRIMNLASGPAREIYEILDNSDIDVSQVHFDCYDLDVNAIGYARELLSGKRNVDFYRKNAIRLALTKDILKELNGKYDLIYSTGLFDYLNIEIASKLVSNLKKALNEGGNLAVASASEKENNPSASWMEWVAEWYLIYRDEDKFRKIFINAGFTPDALKIKLQSHKVMRYCCAEHS